MPNMTLNQHFRTLTDKLAKSTTIASATTKGQWLIKLLQSKIKDILHSPALANTLQAEQRVREEEQKVIDRAPILTIPRITDAPPIMQARNSTATAKKSNENYTAASLEIDLKQYPRRHTFDQKSPSDPKQ
jgi:hypothetical protein